MLVKFDNFKDFFEHFYAASSSLKGQSDKEKYEKARTLKVLSCFVCQPLLISCFFI